jgi:predicted nucleic acid-binding Zn ribbon protein
MSDNNNSRIRVNIHDDVYDHQLYTVFNRPHVSYDNPFNELVFNLGGDIPPSEEIRSVFDRISMLDVMAGFFTDFIGGEEGYGMSEEEMVQIAQRESLAHYKTYEKKPNVKLDIECKSAPNTLKDENCTICVSEIEEGEQITELECKHILHTSCITEWVKYKSECPVCRHAIKTTNEDETTEVDNQLINNENNMGELIQDDLPDLVDEYGNIVMLSEN